MKSPNILIVDDVDDVLESTELLLKREFNVFTASNEIQAWQILKSENIDCLVVDLELNGISGIELIKKMHQNNYITKTILIGGSYLLINEELLKSADVGAYIKKPYDPSYLIKTVKTLLGSKN